MSGPFYDTFATTQVGTLAGSIQNANGTFFSAAASRKLIIGGVLANTSIQGATNIWISSSALAYSATIIYTPVTVFSLNNVAVTFTLQPPQVLNVINKLSLQLFDSVSNFTVDLFGTGIPGSTYVFTIDSANYPGINLSAITSISIILQNNMTPGVALSTTIRQFSSVITCLASDTDILLEDGKTKQIQHIKRGDSVASDSSLTNTYKVANVNKLILEPKNLIDIYQFKHGSLGLNLPNKDLFITGNHPIIWKDARRPSKCLKNLQNIINHDKSPINTVLPIDINNEYALYDLQFEVDGTYVANGVVVQSRSPHSDLTPLSEDLFFDKSLYSTIRVWDSLTQKLPLDMTIL